jgi:hypothetical protein
LNLEPLKALRAPAALNDLIARCTAKQLLQRPESLAPVCEDLEKMIRPEPAGTLTKTLETPSASRPAAVPDPAPVAPPPPRPDPLLETDLQPLPAGLPKFLEKLPPFFRSQIGLMILAGASVLAAMALVYEALSLAHLV